MREGTGNKHEEIKAGRERTDSGDQKTLICFCSPIITYSSLYQPQYYPFCLLFGPKTDEIRG
jgi:hypothetical protein